MKVALLMSGQCRQLWLTAPSINKYVIEPNNADCFLYLTRDSMEPPCGDHTEEIVKQVFNKNVKSLIFTDEAHDKEAEKLIESNYAKIDNQYKKLNRSNWDKQLNHHNTRQYLQLKKCCESAVEYANKNNFKYDIIARVRPDIGWLNKFDLLRPVSTDTLYVNYSEHTVVDKAYPWVEDTCVFGAQDSVLKLWTAFSEKMVDELEICSEKQDLTCATEKLLARVLIDSGIKYASINEYFDYKALGWIRPKLSKYFTDWTKSPNYNLIERFGENGLAVYFDRIGWDGIELDQTIKP